MLRFLRETPGSEALGISYGAAYVKAVPPRALTAEPLDAIAQMAERLADQASGGTEHTAEIARRLARLAQAPFLKVEATKFTEVGYVGRDVEQIARDLVEIEVADNVALIALGGDRHHPRDRVCVTQRAVLGFHAASYYDDTRRSFVATRAGTRLVMRLYPPEIRNWIDRHGGLTPRIMALRGRELAALYRTCQ